MDWNVLEWQDMIIIVANNVPKELFEDVGLIKEMRVWKIPDTIGKESRIKVIKMIEERIKGFTELSDKYANSSKINVCLIIRHLLKVRNSGFFA